MSIDAEISRATHTVEAGFLDFLSGLAQDYGGFLLVKRSTEDQRVGAWCVLRNLIGVEITVEVEVTWDPAWGMAYPLGPGVGVV